MSLQSLLDGSRNAVSSHAVYCSTRASSSAKFLCKKTLHNTSSTVFPGDEHAGRRRPFADVCCWRPIGYLADCALVLGCGLEQLVDPRYRARSATSGMPDAPDDPSVHWNT